MKTVLLLLSVALTLQGGLVAPYAYAIGRIQQTATAAPQDLSTPQKTIETFFAALDRADMSAMVSCVQGAEVSPDSTLLQKEFVREIPSKSVLSNFKIYKDETGEEALVTFSLELRPPLDGSLFPKKTQETALVRKTGETWKIVVTDLDTLNKEGYPQISATTFNVALMVRYPEAMRKARGAAQATLSLSNVKQIATGLLVYSQDYDDVLVPDATKYNDAVKPYVKNNALFTSPLDPAGTISYKFNPQLARKAVSKIAEPTNTVMVFEGEYKKPLFRYDGRAVIGFVDGHAKFVTPEEAAKLRWTP